jgi:hypothetical protein
MLLLSTLVLTYFLHSSDYVHRTGNSSICLCFPPVNARLIVVGYGDMVIAPFTP